MIKCNERAAPLLSTTEKICLIFYDTNNHKNGKNNSCAASIFNETYFLKCIQLSYLDRKNKGRKNLNSNNHLSDTKFN